MLVTPNFYFIFETSKLLSVCGRSLKKIYRVENFRANVLNGHDCLIGQNYSIEGNIFWDFEN